MMKPNTLKDRTVRALKRSANAALGRFDLAIVRRDPNPACTLEWIEEAQRDGMAVNDFIEKDQRKPARSELERLVFPRLGNRPIVCELGPGTGVYTRHISQAVTDGEFHVVDSDPNAIAFLRKHLPENPAVRLYRNSGTELPFDRNGWVDLVFCASMFTGGNLSYFYRYLQEFHRVLKPGAVCVFDYFDVTTEAGWTVLRKNMARPKPIFAYAYHATATVDRMLDEVGFDLVDRFPTVRGSVFVTGRRR
jgi:ubiquinone/menaquinone biosynthesis C-methylase UbiE